VIPQTKYSVLDGGVFPSGIATKATTAGHEDLSVLTEYGIADRHSRR
jgi:hypothetical protein